ncbi:hypothetical protein [Oceanobacillus damuensis]|uniref:hypothetical protein n=1 Tax=Oceanobacillus damuensis TaxID=937928 RepID=UPI000831FA69|nr:hypothetical protein [Oceanobacillus damuensis]
MWNWLMERLPGTIGFIFVFLAFFIPYITYKINTMLHKDGDPPWKKEEMDKQAKDQQPLN